MSELAWKRKSGEPQILRGIRCVGCGQTADEQHLCLMKLSKPQACGLCLQATGKWTGPAWWLVSHTSACDTCIRAMADMNSDNEAFLQPALADIAARKETAK